MTGQIDLVTPISYLKCHQMFPGETLQWHFDLLDIKGVPVVCTMNEVPVLRKDWNREVTIFDRVQFIALPLGGGGGFSKILAAVAAIALAVFAPYAAPLIAGFLNVGTAFVPLITAGILIGGSLLINALLPPAVPGGQQQDTTSTGTNASPTYNLSAQGNAARLLGVIPKVYGRHILFPDFASIPYSSYEGNDQYLYQLFCLGLGEYNVEEVRIEDTPVWTSINGYTDSFSDVEIEIINPGDAITLFPGAVLSSVEVGGQELFKFSGTRLVDISGNTITYAGTADDKLQNIAVGDEITLSGSNSNGIYRVTEVEGNGGYIVVDSTLATQNDVNVTFSTVCIVGPFILNEPDRETNKIQLDFVCPRGIYYAQDNGSLSEISISVKAEARLIDNLGDPLGSWFTLGTHTFTKKTATPQRFTQEYSVTLGRYEVRCQRTSAKESSTRYGNDLNWGGARAFLPDDNIYEDVTLLAVKMRASNQLTERSSRKFSTIQTSCLPIWDGQYWSSPTPTQSPAWIAADLLRNTVYGAGLSDGRIDLQALISLDSTWASRGDKFNAVFDSKRSVWDALSVILRAGRAQPLLIAGTISFVRDEQATVVRGMLTPRNILKGSFETSHILYDDDTPDGVIVEFFDERNWKMNEVLCVLDGTSNENPARIQILGITSRTQAWREGIYQAAANLYRRLFASCSIELEGRMLIRGDTVVVSHDLTQWGYSAEVEGWDAGTRTITVSEPVSGTVCGLSDRKGKLWGPVTVDSISADGFTAVLNSASLTSIQASMGTIPINLDYSEEPTRIAFGSISDYVKRFKVVSSSPNGLESVGINLTVDDSRVYAADVGSPPSELDPYGPGVSPNAPSLYGLTVNQDPLSLANPVTLNVSWDPADGATSYLVQASPDGVTWTTVYSSTGTNFQFTHVAGAVYIKAAAVGVIRGEWAYPGLNPVVYGAPPTSPAKPSNLAAVISPTAGTMTVSWNAATNAQRYRVRVYIEGSILGIYDTLVLDRTTTSLSTVFTSSEMLAVGGLWSSLRVSVEGNNDAVGYGRASNVVKTGITISAPASISLVATYTGVEVNVTWGSIGAAADYVVEVIRNSEVKATFTTSSTSLLITNAQLITAGGPWNSFIVSVKSRNGDLLSPAIRILVQYIASVTLSTTASVNAVTLAYAQAAEFGATNYKVYASGSTGFTPGVGNKVYEGTNTSYTSTTSYVFSNTATPIYYKVFVEYLVEGLTNSKMSGEVSGTPQIPPDTGGGGG